MNPLKISLVENTNAAAKRLVSPVETSRLGRRAAVVHVALTLSFLTKALVRGMSTTCVTIYLLRINEGSAITPCQMATVAN